MKKMTKGAIVTGLGVALLLGGGGTLAVWNTEKSAEAGIIASGQLDLEPGTGTWTTAAGTEVDIETYKVVPGESLTYTQPLTVTLEGDNLSAELSIIGLPVNGAGGAAAFDQNEIEYTMPALEDEEGNNVLEDSTLTSQELRGTQTLTATSTFTFKENAEGSMNAALDLGDVGYRLEQQAPSGD